MADRVSLVTGGASGIGRATAIRLAAAGDSIIIADLNASTATVYEGVTAPADWIGNKYTFDGTDWTFDGEEFSAPPPVEIPEVVTPTQEDLLAQLQALQAQIEALGE